MRRILVGLSLLIFLCSAFGGVASADDAYIVQFEARHESVRGLAQRLGFQFAGRMGSRSSNSFLLIAPSSLPPDIVHSLLENEPGVTSVEAVESLALVEAERGDDEERSFRLIERIGSFRDRLAGAGRTNYFGNDAHSDYVEQPAARELNLRQSHRRFTRGGGVVAIIDTGIDPDHPLLRTSLVSGYDFVQGRPGLPSEWNDLDSEAAASLEQSSVAILDQSSIVILNQSTVAILDQRTSELLSDPRYKSFGHGTMVAGLVHLVAPGAKIMPLKAFRADGSSNTADIVSAIYFAVDNGADVINMSFSMDALSPEIMRAINYATRRGVICVSAAGNQGRAAYVFPAGFANVTGVGGTSLTHERSELSNFGEDLVSFSAPSEELVTSYPSGLYAVAFGTSFSAALVSGTAALLVDLDETVDQHDVEDALARGRQDRGDLGYGELDVFKTLRHWRARSRGGRR